MQLTIVERTTIVAIADNGTEVVLDTKAKTLASATVAELLQKLNAVIDAPQPTDPPDEPDEDPTEEPPVDNPAPDPPTQAICYRVLPHVQGLAIRTEPSTQGKEATVVRRLNAGDEVQVLEENIGQIMQRPDGTRYQTRLPVQKPDSDPNGYYWYQLVPEEDHPELWVASHSKNGGGSNFLTACAEATTPPTEPLGGGARSKPAKHRIVEVQYDDGVHMALQTAQGKRKNITAMIRELPLYNLPSSEFTGNGADAAYLREQLEFMAVQPRNVAPLYMGEVGFYCAHKDYDAATMANQIIEIAKIADSFRLSDQTPPLLLQPCITDMHIAWPNMYIAGMEQYGGWSGSGAQQVNMDFYRNGGGKGVYFRYLNELIPRIMDGLTQNDIGLDIFGPWRIANEAVLPVGHRTRANADAVTNFHYEAAERIWELTGGNYAILPGIKNTWQITGHEEGETQRERALKLYGYRHLHVGEIHAYMKHAFQFGKVHEANELTTFEDEDRIKVDIQVLHELKLPIYFVEYASMHTTVTRGNESYSPYVSGTERDAVDTGLLNRIFFEMRAQKAGVWQLASVNKRVGTADIYNSYAFWEDPNAMSGVYNNLRHWNANILYPLGPTN